MDKLMDSPWFLRLTALVLAVILFVSIQGEEGKINGKSPGDQIDMIADIPVKVYYDNENLIVTGVPETVQMTIEGPANIVETTKLLKDFTLFVDLNELTMGEHRVEIQHENISDKLKVKFEPETIDILIEEKITQTFRVDPELNDRLLKENFYITNMEVEPKVIEVTGAKSVVEAISFVKATVTGEEGINKSFEQKARVRVLDKDLNKLNVVISPEEVTVKVGVSEYHKEVPITLRKIGDPPPGVDVGSLTAAEKIVTLYGPRKVLDEIGELIVDVDVSKVKELGTVDVELKMPIGVSSMSLEKVKVKIEGTVSETETEPDIDVDEDTSPAPDSEDDIASTDVPKPTIETKTFDDIQIAVKGLDTEFTSMFLKPVNGALTLKATADSKIIEKLEKTDFVVYVNAAEIAQEGEQVFSVSVEGPEEVSWELTEDKVTIKIELA
ncbi:CdaR family protein [Sporosarcina sp. G11-34]|uniref:CdaR family protein n=1 Tax=Sporosarcina sp. G11-34 TaxID=2849605 RepID=UPI0022A9F64C|nr:CdaR family protein [Sporosarcina sp. G11-34]MCZ2259291.1 hypothetical protein [Sporosarcina sp. G11-34]